MRSSVKLLFCSGLVKFSLNIGGQYFFPVVSSPVGSVSISFEDICNKPLRDGDFCIIWFIRHIDYFNLIKQHFK